VKQGGRSFKVTDVSPKVFDQFLSFLYNGEMKDRRYGNNSDPTWVVMVPQLVSLAYDVSDLSMNLSSGVKRQSIKC